MNNLTNEVFKYTLKQLNKGISLEEISDELIERGEKFLDCSFDLSHLKEYSQYIITLLKAQEPKDENEILSAYTNTINNYEFNDSLLKNELLTLIKNDKIIIENEIPIFIKLDSMFFSIFTHLSMLERYLNEKEKYETKKQNNNLTILTSKSEKNDDLVNPKINTLEKTYQMLKNDQIKHSINIYKNFKKDALETDLVLNFVSSFPKESIKDPNFDIDSFIQARDTFEVSDVNIGKEKIIESMAIYIFSIYREGSYLNNLMNITRELSRTKVSNITNIILSNLFEDKKFDYRHTHVIKPTQHCSTLFDFTMPILEFRNTRNYKEHPIFEKEAEEDLLSFFKSN